MLNDQPLHANEQQIKSASNFTSAQLAVIQSRLKSKTTAQPKETIPTALKQEIKKSQQQHTPTFPRAAVTAAVRAADILMPDELERRTLFITELYLKKIPAEQIAQTLELDPETVKIEIRRIDDARAVAFKHNPALAQKVAEKHFDVMAETIKSIEVDNKILAMVEYDLTMAHQDAKAYELNKTYNDIANTDDDEEDDDTPAGKKKKKYRPGLHAMKIDSYFKGREVIGKQLDRIATILGLLGKHAQMPQGNTNVQINQNVQFTSEKLNALADQFLANTGNSIAQIAREHSLQELTPGYGLVAAQPQRQINAVIDVVPEQLDEAQ